MEKAQWRCLVPQKLRTNHGNLISEVEVPVAWESTNFSTAFKLQRYEDPTIQRTVEAQTDQTFRSQSLCKVRRPLVVGSLVKIREIKLD